MHAVVLRLLGIPFRDTHLRWCGSGPCIIYLPVFGTWGHVNNFTGGLGTAFVLICLYLLLRKWPTHKRCVLVGGAIVAFIIGYQIAVGLMEGIDNNWYQDKTTAMARGLLQLLAGILGIVLHICMTGFGRWLTKLRSL